MPMRSTNTNMTIAEYREQLDKKQITINHDYQRTDAVWPLSAKSNLIDTILNGFPMPKLIFSQTTDLDTLKTRKEVVDGQQRTAAIMEFVNNKFALTRGDFASSRFAELDNPKKHDFLAYELSIDVFTSGSDEEIREVFRRINSYQVPLNHQERRHATHQGEFKWFIRDLGKKYSTTLIKIGSMTEKQVSRMADLELLTELVHLLKFGVKTASPSSLDKLFTDNDKTFPDVNAIQQQMDFGLGKIINWQDIHKTKLVTRANLYSLFGAIIAVEDEDSKPAESIDADLRGNPAVDEFALLSNLTQLAEALESDNPKFPEFVAAAKQGTNTEKNRRTRLRWFYKAMTSTDL
jgi:hypothetical protein